MMFYQRKKYDLAIECFERLGMDDAVKKVLAVQARSRAQETQHRLEMEYRCRVQDKAKNQDFYFKLKKQVFPDFLEAAHNFDLISQLYNAGHCFYAAE